MINNSSTPQAVNSAILNDDLVYQALAYNTSALSAAENFARSYFDKPRQVVDFTPGDEQHPATFMLKDGRATYRIQYDPGIKLVSSPVFKIYRKAVNNG
jgi:hypothetical protein